MPVREVVLNLVGPRLDAVQRAHDTLVRADAVLREAALNQAIARDHMKSVLAAATNEDAKGLRFDPEQGTIYREIRDAKGGDEA